MERLGPDSSVFFGFRLSIQLRYRVIETSAFSKASPKLKILVARLYIFSVNNNEFYEDPEKTDSGRNAGHPTLSAVAWRW
jgi:hypothetical protein